MNDPYKVQQLQLMLSHEQGDGENVGYGANLSHWYGDAADIQLDAGAIKALIEYYGGKV